MGVLDELGPAIGDIISTSSEVTEAVLPLVVKLIEELAPVIHSITESIGKAVSAILPALCKIIEGIIQSYIK
jgi:phage-related protein